MSDTTAAKLSYEWATRLPSSLERFGDAVRIDTNVQSQPEMSHNLNAEVSWSAQHSRWGHFSAQLAVFGRWVDDLIVPIRGESLARYENVLQARSLGAEVSLGCESEDQRFALFVNDSQIDLRNTSSTAPLQTLRVNEFPTHHSEWAIFTVEFAGTLPSLTSSNSLGELN